MTDIDAPMEQTEEPAAPRRNRPRTPVRQNPVRTESGRTVVRGRDGEPLTRQRSGTADPFEIPPELIPEGWSYQWNAVSAFGNTDVLLDINMSMHENGWRPVPAERHPGRFVPAGTKGAVIRGGQMLMERPLALTEEARREDMVVAQSQIRDRNEAIMGRRANLARSMPDGFSMGANYRGAGARVNVSMDPGADIPRPNYQFAELGE